MKALQPWLVRPGWLERYSGSQLVARIENEQGCWMWDVLVTQESGESDSEATAVAAANEALRRAGWVERQP